MTIKVPTFTLLLQLARKIMDKHGCAYNEIGLKHLFTSWSKVSKAKINKNVSIRETIKDMLCDDEAGIYSFFDRLNEFNEIIIGDICGYLFKHSTFKLNEFRPHIKISYHIWGKYAFWITESGPITIFDMFNASIMTLGCHLDFKERNKEWRRMYKFLLNWRSNIKTDLSILIT